MKDELEQKMMEKVISFQLNKTIKPIIKVVESPLQIISCLIPYDGAHITLHRTDAGILQTLWDKKYWSVHSPARINIAGKLGYRNSQKHAHYLFQRESTPDDILLWSHRIDFTTIPDNLPKRYLKNHLIMTAPAKTFWLTFYFSQSDKIIENAIKFSFSLGNLYIECEDRN